MSFVDIRDRMLRGQQSMGGAKGYMEDMYRASGRLPPRPDASAVHNSARHFGEQAAQARKLQQELATLKRENAKWRATAHKSYALMAEQRAELENFYSKLSESLPKDGDDTRANDRSGGVVHEQPRGGGEDAVPDVPGEVLPADVPDPGGQAAAHADEGRQGAVVEGEHAEE